MRRRYETRADLDDFVRPILNLDILDRFADIKYADFTPLPASFDAGHFDYLSRWEYLFMYETYNILLTSRRTTSKEDDHAKKMNQVAQVMKPGESKPEDQPKHSSRPGRKLSWIGYLVQSTKDTYTVNVKMYDQPPCAQAEPSSNPKA